VYGGKLTGLRWPEREIVQVSAAKVYCDPFGRWHRDAAAALSAQHEQR